MSQCAMGLIVSITDVDGHNTVQQRRLAGIAETCGTPPTQRLGSIIARGAV